MKIRLRMTAGQLSIIKKKLAAGNFPVAVYGKGENPEKIEKCVCVSNIYTFATDIPQNESVIIFLPMSKKQNVKDVILDIKEENASLKITMICYVGEYEVSAIYIPENQNIDVVSVVGDMIDFYITDKSSVGEEMSIRTTQVFGAATVEKLKKLKIGVVGVSGTGSVVVEQLIRLGVGELVLVDDDVIEEKNLNRIINSKMSDAETGKLKVNMVKDFVVEAGLNTKIISCNTIVSNTDTIKELSQCDILFGCMDSVDGRHHLNTIATAYLIPYFDVGVKLVADGFGGIEEITTAAHFLQPGGSSLYSRHVYDSGKLSAAVLKRRNPEEYKARLQEKYIEGAQESSPAVISVNMLAASIVVLEFLARVHPYRVEELSGIEVVRMELTNMRVLIGESSKECSVFERYFGIGDENYLLNS